MTASAAIINKARARLLYRCAPYFSALLRHPSTLRVCVCVHTGTKIIVQLLAHKRATLKEVMRPANKSTVNDTRTAASKKR